MSQVVPAPAQTWVPTSAPSLSWYGVACSSNGSNLIAAARGNGLYCSSDAGVTWTQALDTNANWCAVASSADGHKLVAAMTAGGIFTSTDAGATWTQIAATNDYWYSVASSADGNLLAACSASGVNYSTNRGATWLSASLPYTYNRYVVAISADGSKMVAANGYGGIFTSMDAGSNWTQTSAPTNDWQCVVSSVEGKRLAAAIYSGSIYLSTDAGGTWARSGAPANSWESLACSADGAKLMAATYAGAIFASDDAGVSWAASSASGNWLSLAAAADGSQWFAANNTTTNKGLYLWQVSAPVILTQPASRSLLAQSALALQANSFGLGPTSWQWPWNGTNLDGATNSTFSLPFVIPSNSGLYSVLVSNAYGSVLSSNTVLTVVPAWPMAYSVSGITLTGALLSAGANLPATNATVWIEWGLDPYHVNTVGMLATNGTSYVSWSTFLTGLSVSNLYHFRVAVSNVYGIAYSADQTFQLGVKPVVAMLPATDITTNSAILHATINPGYMDTKYCFRWWTTNSSNAVSGTVLDAGAGGDPIRVSCLITNLSLGTIYTAQAWASNSFGTATGSNFTFLTGPWVLTNSYQIDRCWSADTKVRWSGSLTSLSVSTNAGRNWAAVARPLPYFIWAILSADGSRVVAGFSSSFGQNFYRDPESIFVSTNYGAAWTQASSPASCYWGPLACSTDGAELFAMANDIYGLHKPILYSSTDGGSTWSLRWTNSGSAFTNMSAPANGTWVIALENGFVSPSHPGYGGVDGTSTPGFIEVSTNGGLNWDTRLDLTTNVASHFYGQRLCAFWSQVASSADGTRLAVSAFVPSGGSYSLNNVSTNGSIFGSYGYYPPLISNYFFGVLSPGLYLSTDSGWNWFQANIPLNNAPISSVACSADGGTIVALAAWSASSSGSWSTSTASLKQYLCVSRDGGTNWMVSLVLGSCTNVSCSADGNSMLAWIVLSPSITPGQGRLVLQTQPAPVLGITRAAGHAALSWLVPSSDFTIEQTTDLSTPNWISVSNPMVLNFTNLQNQVTLPQPTGNAFYRLRH